MVSPINDFLKLSVLHTARLQQRPSSSGGSIVNFCKLYPPEEEGRCCYRAVRRTESCRKSCIGEAGLLLADGKKRHNYVRQKTCDTRNQIRCAPPKELGSKAADPNKKRILETFYNSRHDFQDLNVYVQDSNPARALLSGNNRFTNSPRQVWARNCYAQDFLRQLRFCCKPFCFLSGFSRPLY